MLCAVLWPFNWMIDGSTRPSPVIVVVTVLIGESTPFTQSFLLPAWCGTM